MCFSLFSDVLFFLLPGSEHEVGREFFMCEDAAFFRLVCPRLVFSNAVLAHTSSSTAYDLSPRRWAGTAFVLGMYQISVA